MVTVEFTHTNNGGYWWLNDLDWSNLELAGWRITGDTTATYSGETFEEALSVWQRVLPDLDPNDVGCECCSRPFIFTVINEWDDEPWSSDYDELSYQSYSLGWGDF